MIVDSQHPCQDGGLMLFAFHGTSLTTINIFGEFDVKYKVEALEDFGIAHQFARGITNQFHFENSNSKFYQIGNCSFPKISGRQWFYLGICDNGRRQRLISSPL